MTDYTGLATLIASCTASVVSIVTLLRGKDRDKKIAEVHELVNGQSKRLEVMARGEGFKAGADWERSSPNSSASKT